MLTNFYHSFYEYHINDTLEGITQQYIMKVFGTAICVRIAYDIKYTATNTFAFLYNAKHYDIFHSAPRQNLLHITKIY